MRPAPARVGDRRAGSRHRSDAAGSNGRRRNLTDAAVVGNGVLSGCTIALPAGSPFDPRRAVAIPRALG
jgi:hypothetical protein